MQVCKNPVGKGHPIIGKFAKEDQHGALCCHKIPDVPTDYEYAYISVPSGTGFATYTFAQNVMGFLIRVQQQFYPTYKVEWQTPNGNTIVVFQNMVYEWFIFTGKTLKIVSPGYHPPYRFWLYGFY